MTSAASRRLRVAVCALALCAGVSACSGIANLRLGSGSVSVCYRAIPAAIAAVHDRGARLIGVHSFSAGWVSKRLPVELTTHDVHGAVCAVALKGPFAAGQVPGQGAGTYAVVFVTSNNLHVAGQVIIDRLPRRFRGRTF